VDINRELPDNGNQIEGDPTDLGGVSDGIIE